MYQICKFLILTYDILTVRTVKVKSLIIKVLVHNSLFILNTLQIYHKSSIYQNVWRINMLKNRVADFVGNLLDVFYNLLVAGTCFGLLGGVADANAEQRLVTFAKA